MLNFTDIKDKIISLLEAKFELKKLEIQDKAEGAIANLIFGMAFLILASIFLVFILILATFFLNNWLGAPYGTLVTITFLALLLGLFYAQKAKIKSKIKGLIEKELDVF